MLSPGLELKRLLITGGRGFIGRHCLVPALEAGHEVHAVASSARRPLIETDPPVAWHTVDLLAPGEVEKLIEAVKPTHILHTAWETTHGSYWSSATNLDWLALITRIVRSFATYGGQRIITAGSCAEYDWAGGVMHENVTANRPHTFYGRIKLAHHDVLMAAAAQFGFSAATGRIFFGYGPHENSSRIIPYACQQLAKGEAAEFSSGNQLRDFMHVYDIGRGFITLLDSDISGICNVSFGEAVSLSEIVTKLGEIAGRPELVKLGARHDRPDDVAILCGDNSLLKYTGWKPTISLEHGLADTFAWWQKRFE